MIAALVVAYVVLVPVALLWFVQARIGRIVDPDPWTLRMAGLIVEIAWLQVAIEQHLGPACRETAARIDEISAALAAGDRGDR